MRSVSRAAVPDMPDRIVAAAAVYFAVPVLSPDGRIRGSNVQTVWLRLFWLPRRVPVRQQSLRQPSGAGAFACQPRPAMRDNILDIRYA